eukprot:scaffold4777_cov120-Skeletonema_dohrnii-CCMP3373.AAC.6
MVIASFLWEEFSEREVERYSKIAQKEKALPLTKGASAVGLIHASKQDASERSGDTSHSITDA